jgi:peptidoglycan hydrolase-like protein with peptidoglycan-binding domain
MAATRSALVEYRYAAPKKALAVSFPFSPKEPHMALNSALFAGNARLEQAANNSPVIMNREPDRAAVRLIQRALVALVPDFPMPNSFPGGEPDGQFGNETYNAVLAFQQKVFPGDSNEWDGRVGRHTLGKMDSLLPANFVVVPAPVKVISQPPGEAFVIFSRPDDPTKRDLDSTSRPFNGSREATDRVTGAGRLFTADLWKEMSSELSRGGGSLGTQMFDAFKNNGVAGREIRFENLNTAVADSGEFETLATQFEAAVETNLRAQFKAGTVDFRDLVTGTGPVRRETPAATEAGKQTGRMLPSLNVHGLSFKGGASVFTGKRPLKVVIGSFQGIKIMIQDLKVSLGAKPFTFTAKLIYQLRDHFGVDDSDCELDSHGHGSPGQVAFWVLQHHRHKGMVNFPFITVVVVEREIKGSLGP